MPLLLIPPPSHRSDLHITFSPNSSCANCNWRTLLWRMANAIIRASCDQPRTDLPSAKDTRRHVVHVPRSRFSSLDHGLSPGLMGFEPARDPLFTKELGETSQDQGLPSRRRNSID